VTESLDALITKVESRTGLELSRGGARDALMRHLRRRLLHHRLGEGELHRYLALLGDAQNGEFQELIDAITVPHTWFMRDAEQLEVAARLIRSQATGSRPLSVWVPGCATGEDAYSIALMAARVGRQVNVLGTDVNMSALARARRGHYGRWSLRELPPAELGTFPRAEGGYAVPENVKKMVSFARHNLLEPKPEGGPWDLIVCRNVLIYFLPAHAKATLVMLGEALTGGGVLLLGASDIVLETPVNLVAHQIADKLVFTRRGVDTPRPPRLTPRPPPPPMPRPAPPPRVEVKPAPEPAPVDDLSLGHRHLASGELAAALRAYQVAADRDPLSGAARMYIGVTRHLMGELETAVEELRAASFLAPSLWPASFYLALCYESLGRALDARREYRHAARVCQALTKNGTPLNETLDATLGPFRAFGRDLAQLAERRAHLMR
jgi:chemotaxis protein methyltransferase CheR